MVTSCLQPTCVHILFDKMWDSDPSVRRRSTDSDSNTLSVEAASPVKLEDTEKRKLDCMASTAPPTLPLPERFRSEMDVVTLPKSQFLKMVERVKNYETRLQAVRNLQDLLHEKNKDLFFTKRDYKAAQQKMKELEEKTKELDALHNAKEVESLKQQDSGFSSSVLTPPASDCGMVEDDHSYTSRSQCSKCSSVLKSATQHDSPSNSPSLLNDAPVSLDNWTVSKEVFDKVVKEREILQRTINDLFESRGTSMQGFAGSRENECTILNLRKELQECKHQLEMARSESPSRNQKLAEQKKQLDQDVMKKNTMLKKLQEICQNLTKDKQILQQKLCEAKAETDKMDTDQALDFSSNKSASADGVQLQELVTLRQHLNEERVRFERELQEIKKQLQSERQAKQHAQEEVDQYIRNIANMPGCTATSGRSTTYMDAISKLATEKDILSMEIQQLKKKYMEERASLEKQISHQQQDMEVHVRKKKKVPTATLR